MNGVVLLVMRGNSTVKTSVLYKGCHSKVSGRHRAVIYKLDAKDVIEVFLSVGGILAALPRLFDTAGTTIHTRIDALETVFCGETNPNRQHRVALDLEGTRHLLSIHVEYLCVHFTGFAGGMNLCQNMRQCCDGNSLTRPTKVSLGMGF